MAEYLFDCIKKAIHDYIEQEIEFFANYDKTKASIQAIVDMPDKQIDLLITFILQNNGVLSNQKKDQFFSLLTDDETQYLVKIVREIMIPDISHTLKK